MTKVCFITTVHPLSDTRIFHKEARTLAKAGYYVTLIVQHNKNEIVDNIKISALPRPKNRFFRILKTTKQAYKLALQQKADIYHFHDPEFLFWALKLKKLTGANIIYDVHEDIPQQILSKEWLPKFLRKPISVIFNFYEKRKAKQLDFVIAAWPKIREKFRKAGVNNVEVITNYPILEYFQQTTGEKERIRDSEEIKLIYVGGLTRARGIREIIRSLNYVKNGRVKLLLLGKFQERGLENKLRKIPEWRKVEFKGWLPQKEAYRHLKSANIGLICLLPVPNYINAVPNKLFEYMAVGLPVIASNFPLLKRIIKNNKCGLTVNPQEPEEIAKAIEYLIEHLEEAKIMGENGKKAVFEKYNWEKESKKLLNIYNKLNKIILLHSKVYKDQKIFNISHSRRLNKILKMISSLDVPAKGKWADFGCSDGFILNIIHQNRKFKNWEMYGLDHAKRLLSQGKKKYPNFYFHFIELNDFSDAYKDYFNVVSCFETLEHLRNYKTGFDNLYFKLKPTGLMIISVPNEIFLVGAIKFLGRYIRGDAYKYKEILKTKRKEIRYFFDLLLNKDIEKYRSDYKKDIEKYRKYPIWGFSAHLGFNYKKLQEYIQDKYINNSKLFLLNRKNTILGFNKIYLFKKNER